MKYLMIKTKYLGDYDNTMYFDTQEARNAFLEKLHPNWEQELEAQPSSSYIVGQNLTDMTLRIKSQFGEIIDKNLVVIKHSGSNDISVYFMSDIQGDGSSTFTVKAIFNPFLTYFGFLEGKNLNLIEGHSHIENYYSKQYDNGDYEILTKNKLERINKNIEDTGFIYVFEKIDNTQIGFTIEKGTQQVKMPYRILIAPQTPMGIGIDGDQILIDYGNLNAEEQVSNKYFNGEETLNLSIGILEESTQLKLNTGTLHILKSFGENLSFNTHYLTLPLSDFYNKDAFYSLGEDTRNLKNGERVLLARFVGGGNQATYLDVYNVLVKLHYNSTTGILTIKVLNRAELIDVKDNYGYAGSYGITGDSKKEIDFEEDSERYLQESFISDLCGDYIDSSGYNEMGIRNVSIEGETKWDSNRLIEYLNDVKKDANVITQKQSNYNPLITEGDFIEGFESILNISEISEKEGVYQLNYINTEYSEKYNKYEIDLTSLSELQTITGNIPFKLMIEKGKEFPLKSNYIKDGKITFTHKTIPTPNEWEERIDFELRSGQQTYNDDNSWNNEKEGFNPGNNFEVYKSNNPFPFTKDLVQIFGNPLNYMGKVNALSIPGQLASIGLNIASLMRAPNQIRGNGNIYSDLMLNDFGLAFIVMIVWYKGNQLSKTVKHLQRYGTTYENGLFVKFENIQRERFNYVKIDNSQEVLPKRADLKIIWNISMERGIRLWYDYDTFLDYEGENNERLSTDTKHK